MNETTTRNKDSNIQQGVKSEYDTGRANEIEERFFVAFDTFSPEGVEIAIKCKRDL